MKAPKELVWHHTERGTRYTRMQRADGMFVELIVDADGENSSIALTKGKTYHNQMTPDDKYLRYWHDIDPLRDICQFYAFVNDSNLKG